MENTETLNKLRSLLLEGVHTSSNTKEDLIEIMRDVAHKLQELQQEIDYLHWVSMQESSCWD